MKTKRERLELVGLILLAIVLTLAGGVADYLYRKSIVRDAIEDVLEKSAPESQAIETPGANETALLQLREPKARRPKPPSFAHRWRYLPNVN